MICSCLREATSHIATQFLKTHSRGTFGGGRGHKVHSRGKLGEGGQDTFAGDTGVGGGFTWDIGSPLEQKQKLTVARDASSVQS